MKYLLDTNTCNGYNNGRIPVIRQRFLALSANDEVMVSTVTKAELYYGSAKSQTPVRSREKQDAFLSRFSSLPFDDKAAEIYASVRATLERAGTPIRPYDLMIAAIALTHNVILVTHNVREFGRVSHLLIEDWET